MLIVFVPVLRLHLQTPKELDILLWKELFLKGAEQERASKRVEELMAGNKRLTVGEKVGLSIALHYGTVVKCFGMDTSVWDSGVTVSEETRTEGIRIVMHDIAPLALQGVEGLVGARREAVLLDCLIWHGLW